MKKCCCICRRSLVERNQRGLFTHVGHHDKFPDRHSALTRVSINRNKLSGFRLVFVTMIASWYINLKWGTSYRSMHLCTATTEIIQKWYLYSPFSIFSYGPGSEAMLIKAGTVLNLEQLQTHTPTNSTGFLAVHQNRQKQQFYFKSLPFRCSNSSSPTKRKKRERHFIANQTAKLAGTYKESTSRFYPFQ